MEGETKDRDYVGPGKASHCMRVDVGSLLYEGPELVPCLGPARGLPEQI